MFIRLANFVLQPWDSGSLEVWSLGITVFGGLGLGTWGAWRSGRWDLGSLEVGDRTVY